MRTLVLMKNPRSGEVVRPVTLAECLDLLEAGWNPLALRPARVRK